MFPVSLQLRADIAAYFPSAIQTFSFQLLFIDFSVRVICPVTPLLTVLGITLVYDTVLRKEHLKIQATQQSRRLLSPGGQMTEPIFGHWLLPSLCYNVPNSAPMEVTSLDPPPPHAFSAFVWTLPPSVLVLPLDYVPRFLMCVYCQGRRRDEAWRYTIAQIAL
jgi:hypothetical protein